MDLQNSASLDFTNLRAEILARVERVEPNAFFTLQHKRRLGIRQALSDDVRTLDLGKFAPFAPIPRKYLRRYALPESLPEGPASLLDLALAAGASKVLYAIATLSTLNRRYSWDICNKIHFFETLQKNRLCRHAKSRPSDRMVAFCVHMAATTLIVRECSESKDDEWKTFYRFATLLLSGGAAEEVVFEEHFLVDFYGAFASPLELAAWAGNLRVVRALLQAGADPNLRRSVTPLSLASTVEVAHALLLAGATPDPKVPEECWNAFEVAVLSLDLDLASQLAFLARPSSGLAAVRAGRPDFLPFVVRDCGAAPDRAAFVEILRELDPAAVPAFLALLPDRAGSVAALDPCDFALLPAETCLALTPAPALRRAAAAIVKAATHAAYRPGGHGARAAQARFEAAWFRRAASTGN